LTTTDIPFVGSHSLLSLKAEVSHTSHMGVDAWMLFSIQQQSSSRPVPMAASGVTHSVKSPPTKTYRFKPGNPEGMINLMVSFPQEHTHVWGEERQYLLYRYPHHLYLPNGALRALPDDMRRDTGAGNVVALLGLVMAFLH
jgi:hypothetical protein